MICELCGYRITSYDPVQSWGAPPDTAVVHRECARLFHGEDELPSTSAGATA